MDALIAHPKSARKRLRLRMFSRYFRVHRLNDLLTTPLDELLKPSN